MPAICVQGWLMFPQWICIGPSPQTIQISGKRSCCLSEHSWLYCLVKPPFTFCAYLIAFTDWILILPSSPPAPFTHLTKAPSHSERKRGEGVERRNEEKRKLERNWRILHDIVGNFLKSIFRESMGGVGHGHEAGGEKKKKDTARARLKLSKLQKMTGRF